MGLSIVCRDTHGILREQLDVVCGEVSSTQMGREICEWRK